MKTIPEPAIRVRRGTGPLSRIVAATAALSLPALGGCLERLEHITINPDGSAVLRSEFRGTPDDFKRTADALPEVGGPWAVSDTISKNEKDEDRQTRLCTMGLAPDAPWPESYAAVGDPRAPFTLMSPTLVGFRRAPGQTLCDFTRTYVHREESPFTFARRALMETAEGKKLLEADPKSLDGSGRARLLRMFADLEADKHARFIRSAAGRLEAEGLWGQDLALALRRAVFDAAESFDTAETLRLISEPPSPDRDAAIAGQAKAFDAAIDRVVPQTLAALRVPGDQRREFESALAMARSMRGASEDLSDEHWDVRVRMPGEVIAHNADRVENGELVWEFSALAIQDRDQELRATSRVAGEPRR